MAQTRLTITGDQELRRLLRRIDPKQNPRWVTDAMQRSSQLLRSEIRANLEGPRPRKLDRVTGRLWASVRNVKQDYPWQVRVGTRIRWAGKYEFGPIRDRRPFLAPASEAAGPKILGIFSRTVERVIRRG